MLKRGDLVYLAHSSYVLVWVETQVFVQEIHPAGSPIDYREWEIHDPKTLQNRRVRANVYFPTLALALADLRRQVDSDLANAAKQHKYQIAAIDELLATEQATLSTTTELP